MNKLLRYSLVSLLAMFVGTAFAENKDVTFTLNTTDGITELGIALPEAGKGTKVESMSKGGVTIACTTADGKTDTRIYQGSGGNTGKYDFRIYTGGTMTFTAGSSRIKKIAFTGNNLTNLSAEGYDSDTWIGSAASVTITATGTATIYTIVVTFGDEDVTPTVKTLYTEPFTANQGKFSIDDKTKPDALSYVWSFSSSYGAKATAFVSSTAYVTESWLVSPIINLAAATETSLEFTHALNKFADVATAKTQAVVLIKVDGGAWQTLEGVVYPDALSWTFVENAIDLSEFDGRKIQIAFKYTSTAESAGTWEIKPFTIKGKGEATIEFEAPDPSASYGTIGQLLEADAEKAGLTDVEVTLEKAKVLYVSGQNMYVRDTKGAICIYKSGIEAKANYEINGSVRGDLKYYGDDVKMQELETNGYFDKEKLTIAELTEAAEPAATTTLDKATDYMCNLVMFKKLTAVMETEGSSNVYYVTDGTNKVIASQLAGLRDYVESGSEFDLIAVVGVSSKKLRLYPITIVPPPVNVAIAPEPGNISEALKAELAGATAKNVSIKLAAGGKYTITEPIVATGDIMIQGGDGTEIDATALEGPLAQWNGEEPADWTPADVYFKNFAVKGLSKAMFYSAGKKYYGDFVVDNCFVEVAGDATTFDFTKGSVALNVTVMNSTFYAPTATTKAFYSSQGGQKASEYSSEATQTFKFHNNTMVNLIPGKNFFTHRQNNQKWLTYDVKWNVFVDCGKSGQVIKGMNGGQGGANPTWDIQANIYNFGGADTSANEETGDADEPIKDSVAGVLAFTDAAAANFNGTCTLAVGATEPAAQIGDTRWTIEYTFGTAIETLKAAADDAKAVIYNIAGQKVGEGYKGLVIKNGKKFVVK